METTKYIISDDRTKTSPRRCFMYVAAPPGFYRSSSGKIVRDKSISCTKSGPEWTYKRKWAMEFSSPYAALRIANKCGTAKVHPIASVN